MTFQKTSRSDEPLLSNFPFSRFSQKSFLVQEAEQNVGKELSEYIDGLKDCTFPSISNNMLKLKCRCVAFYSMEKEHVGIEIEMPGHQECKFLWCPYPRDFDPGEVDTKKIAKIHSLGDVLFSGFVLTKSDSLKVHQNGYVMPQPRRTLCWGKGYRYSNTEHEMEEDEMPSCVTNLLHITNEMFGLQDDEQRRLNMDLENRYCSGRHSIGEHGDANIKDGMGVYCWVFGDANRLLILRHHKNAMPNAQAKDREIIRISIPVGLYCMLGPGFQEKFSHEIPMMCKDVWKKLSNQLKEIGEKEDIPIEKGNDLTLAEWIVANKVISRRVFFVVCVCVCFFFFLPFPEGSCVENDGRWEDQTFSQ